MADIFLSYKKEDRDRIASFAQHLEAEGFTVWYDYQIETGQDWFEQILREIDVSRVVLGCWSTESVATSGEFTSRYVMLEHRRAPKKLLPVLMDTGRIPFEFSSIQAVDLSGWDGDRSSEIWRRLVAQIEDLATPSWMRRRIAELQANLAAEEAKRGAAEAKAMPIEMRLQEEARKLGEAQIALRAATERADQLLAERDAAQSQAAQLSAAASAPPVLTPKAKRLLGGFGARAGQFLGQGLQLAIKFAFVAALGVGAAFVLGTLAGFAEWSTWRTVAGEYGDGGVYLVADWSFVFLCGIVAAGLSGLAGVVAVRFSNFGKPAYATAVFASSVIATCILIGILFGGIGLYNRPADLYWVLERQNWDYVSLPTRMQFPILTSIAIGFFLPLVLTSVTRGGINLFAWLFGLDRAAKPDQPA